jgi:hypothetical protein
MRFAYVLGFVLILGGVAVAQQPETNFPVGPQYLITQPYPTILQPIATPSYEPWVQSGVVSPQTGEAGPVTITIPAYLPSIYWGYPPPGEVEVVPEPVEAPPNLPEGYIDTGVGAIASSGWLHEHDYGMTLAQAARYWKEHKLHATHVYTNQDIERLQGE